MCVRGLVNARTPLAAQWMTLRTAVFVSLFVPVKDIARQGTIGALIFLPHWDVRLYLFFIDHPVKQWRGSISRVANQAFWLEVKSLLDPIDHDLGRLGLCGPMRGRRFDVDNDARVDIDQVVRTVRYPYA